MIAAPPRELRAGVPAVLRGLRRDGTRLCIVETDSRRIAHSTVSALGEHLEPGSLVVVNSSRTLPGALPVHRADGRLVQLRPGIRRGRRWEALAVEASPPHRNLALQADERLTAPGLTLRVRDRRPDVPLLWVIDVEDGDPLDALLRLGEPIRYSYVAEPVAAEHYQTVYASHPGSVEPPSAGLHLSWELLLALRERGIALVDIVLHCGLSSLQDDAADARKPLLEEWFEVAEEAAAAVNAARLAGRPVVAVGTTVVRALESAVSRSGVVEPRRGWTALALPPRSEIRSVDALFTGLHEPPATHLDMLRALAGDALLERAYAEVGERGYLWHEFGDAMLIKAASHRSLGSGRRLR